MNILTIDNVTKVTAETVHDDPYAWTNLVIESIDYKGIETQTKITLFHRNRSPKIEFESSKLNNPTVKEAANIEVLVEEVTRDSNI